MDTTVEVKAALRWNDGMLDIREGQVVRITASGEWTDDWIRTTPAGFDKPWLAPVKFTRRLPSAPWFCLCATVDRMKRPIHRIGTGGEFVARRSGRLWLFANDAWLFYFNNKGSITATITVADA